MALLDRPSSPLEAFREVFLARLPRAAAFDAWWQIRVPAAAHPPLGGDVPAWRCAPLAWQAVQGQADAWALGGCSCLYKCTHGPNAVLRLSYRPMAPDHPLLQVATSRR